MTKDRLLFLVILIEGYVVLAVELLTIRQLLPFVGSGVEVVSIVISGVLLPLAAGYHYGGTAYRRMFAKVKARGHGFLSVRRILSRNILLALFILSFGLSYLFLEDFFLFLRNIGIQHRLWQTLIYTVVFLVTPVFCLGQTVPLVSQYFSRRRLSEITGRMLFFSTAGSFLGSVFSTLVLMMTVGVHNTVIFTLALLALLCILLSRRKRRRAVWLATAFFLIGALLNNGYSLRLQGFVSDNAYSIARIWHPPNEDITYLLVNRSMSSVIGPDPNKPIGLFKYIDDNFIATMPHAEGSRDILVIGAGGFVVGIGDDFNNYTFVDINPDLKQIAEDDFQKQKLGPKKRFIASSARAFLRGDNRQYDLVFVDVFQNTYSIPMECTTREFLQAVKAHIKPNGIFTTNISTTPDFRDKFSVRYDNTFSSVFPVHNRQVVNNFNPWQTLDPDDIHARTNVLYIYFNRPTMQDNTAYTDDKNTYSIDVP